MIFKQLGLIALLFGPKKDPQEVSMRKQNTPAANVNIAKRDDEQKLRWKNSEAHIVSNFLVIDENHLKYATLDENDKIFKITIFNDPKLQKRYYQLGFEISKKKLTSINKAFFSPSGNAIAFLSNPDKDVLSTLLIVDLQKPKDFICIKKNMKDAIFVNDQEIAIQAHRRGVDIYNIFDHTLSPAISDPCDSNSITRFGDKLVYLRNSLGRCKAAQISQAFKEKVICISDDTPYLTKKIIAQNLTQNFVAIAAGKKIVIRDVATSQLIKELNYNTNIAMAQSSPCGKYIAVVEQGDASNVHIYSIAENKKIAFAHANWATTKPLASLSWSFFNNSLITSNKDGQALRISAPLNLQRSSDDK